MPVNDPVGDMLTRIRNAIKARHDSTSIPISKMKIAIAKILKEEGYIRDYDVPRGAKQLTLRLHLYYRENREPAITGLKRISKPGLRIYVGKGDIRERLLAHLNGDNPCILRSGATHWVGEVTNYADARERELIKELTPSCNVQFNT